MSVSMTLLDRRDSQGRNLRRLNGDYHHRLGPHCMVVVPSGYITNFGTIPRWAYWLITPDELREAALVHDWMCNEEFGDELNQESGFTRWMADAVLFESMGSVGIGPIRKRLVYLAVRGWANFKGIK